MACYGDSRPPRWYTRDRSRAEASARGALELGLLATRELGDTLVLDDLVVARNVHYRNIRRHKVAGSHALLAAACTELSVNM